MTRLSFKTYLTILETPDDEIENVLSEIFGAFATHGAAEKRILAQRQKAKDLQSQAKDKIWANARMAAQSKRALTPAELKKIKDKMWQDAKFSNDDTPNPVSVRD